MKVLPLIYRNLQMDLNDIINFKLSEIFNALSIKCFTVQRFVQLAAHKIMIKRFKKHTHTHTQRVNQWKGEVNNRMWC